MENIFIENSDGNLVRTTRKELLQDILGDELNWEAGAFGDDSSNWIEIRKRSCNNKKEYSLVLAFDENRDKIIDVRMWECDVREIVDEDSSKSLV